ncbi:OmpA family protein [Szabonella alba]|uniref:OmpA family protein n=1 Tax=Szabonella alba TaxID=2804194 RepID=A0A8K0VBZ2_9RHOB|nr:OmpA family protein [Szabonella alba]MBL4916452.1 OmpA family protein [Szabonella alba]
MKRSTQLLLSASLLALAACGSVFEREAGGITPDFGNATMNNTMIHNGQKSYAQILTNRFAQEVPDTITFAFDSARLDADAIQVLTRQAGWIRQFPELRFRVYGHTDLVGSDGYNRALGQRRAEAVVAFFASQGISRTRLEALVSYGKTRPVIQTSSPEERNRRTVTEVSGFVGRHPTVLNGKYAQVIAREYIESATRPHPGNNTVATQLTPGG